MIRNLILFLVAVTLSASSAAQQKQQMSVQKTTSAPTFAGVFHPSTGLQSNSGNTTRSGPVTIYNNNRYTNYFSYGGANQEWVDNGKFLDRNHDHLEQISSFDFTYCSTDTNPNGVFDEIRFYDESIYCAGPPSWPISNCAYQLPGLPGGINGNLACWIILVDLAGTECNLTTDPQGNRSFGWSSTWDSNVSGPWVSSGGLGQTDTFTWWDRNAPNANSGYLGCYWGLGVWAGFAMAAYGPHAETSAVDCPRGANDSLFLSVDDEVQIGNTVSWAVTGQSPGATTHWWASPTVVCQDLNASFGIDAHEVAEYSTRVAQDNATGIHTLIIPPSAGGGMTWYTQAATHNGSTPTAMSNGLKHYVF